MTRKKTPVSHPVKCGLDRIAGGGLRPRNGDPAIDVCPQLRGVSHPPAISPHTPLSECGAGWECGLGRNCGVEEVRATGSPQLIPAGSRDCGAAVAAQKEESEAGVIAAQGDGWTLRLGDCLAGLRDLADKSVDATIEDPPYSDHVEHGQAVSGTRVGRARQQVVRKQRIGVGFMTEADILSLCSHLVRVTRSWIVLFCAFEQVEQYKRAIESAGGRYVRACAWEKPDASPQFSGDRPATWGEAFVVAHATADGPMRWNGGGKRGLYRAGVCRGHERSEHPTQKPLSLMLELVEDFSNPGDLVLDSFAGSGTTGVACRQLGRSFLGWELNRDYFEIACRRLRGDEAKPNPAQPSLFGERTP